VVAGSGGGGRRGSYTVCPLGRNGLDLNAVHLVSGVTALLPPGSRLRIGPAYLYFCTPVPVPAQAGGAGAGAGAGATVGVGGEVAADGVPVGAVPMAGVKRKLGGGAAGGGGGGGGGGKVPTGGSGGGGGGGGGGGVKGPSTRELWKQVRAIGRPPHARGWW
jgi:hypothetical protein